MVEERYRPKFVGFYWTLAVAWKGMIHNFPDIETAVNESKTIRYQREKVHEYVRSQNGVLVREIAFRDVSNDRMTDAISGEVKKAVDICKDGATLLWVRFDECGWRRHRFIREALTGHEDRHIPLPPEPTDWFNPREHFSAWRVHEEQERERRRIEVPQKLREAAAEFPPEKWGRHRRIAEWLNARGVPTLGGGLEWKADNVAKALKNMSDSEGEEPSSPSFF